MSESELLDPKLTLLVPHGKTNDAYIINMTEVYEAEARIQEVAFVTQDKAPELLAFFNKVFLDVSRYISTIEYELVQANIQVDKRKSVVILDKVPEILEAKGFSQGKFGNADLREAVLNLDDEYLALVDKAAQIRAIKQLLKGKLEAFEWAYSSIKKIVGERMYAQTSNPYLKDGGNEESPDSNNPFGNPRY